MENRFATLVEAEVAATKLTEASTDGTVYIAYDAGYVYNPFEVAALPKVGNEVSREFNGDAYPCGKIVKISPTYSKITTDTGVTFTRVAPMAWREGGKKGVFWMVAGVVSKYNLEF